MNLYNDKKDYEELVKQNIEKAKLLHSLSDKDRTLVIKLLNKKEEIKNKNGILANFLLNRINNKIEKIKKVSQK